MSMCADDINRGIKGIIEAYGKLNEELHLSVEDDRTKYEFESQSELVNTLVKCKKLMIESLKLYTYITEDVSGEISYENMRDLYKLSHIRVTYAIIYHDLKNVFIIVDMADSSKSDMITIQSITEQDLDNIYAAMLSFMIETTRAYAAKFDVGGVQRGTRQRRAVN